LQGRTRQGMAKSHRALTAPTSLGLSFADAPLAASVHD
jgi:hypothetical protein